MNSIENYAYQSELRTIDPRIKVFVTMLTLFTTVGIYHLVISAVVLIIMALMIVIVAKVKPRVYVAALSVPMSFIVLSAMTLAIVFARSSTGWCIPFFSGYLCITNDSLQLALTAATTALAATHVLFFMMFTTPLIDLLYALRRWRLPTLLTSLMMLMYKFIFILIAMSRQMYLAQFSRLGYRNMRLSYQSVAHIASTLFVRAIKKTNRMIDALESRGYRGEFIVLDITYQSRIDILIAAVAFNIALIAFYCIALN